MFSFTYLHHAATGMMIKTESHDVNFVVTGGTGGCRYDSSGATSDDEVGIMITLVETPHFP